MILIFLTWVYMAFVFIVQGECLNRMLFRNKLTSFAGLALLGMIFQAILISVVAFFIRIDVVYFCCNTAFSLGLFWFNRDSLRVILRSQYRWVFQAKMLFCVILLLALARSALLPFMVDNESYYIQAIKWLNEYGWVKGIANLHIFLSHANPWQALQAGYNFSFIAGIFNDLNGFLLVLTAYLWVEKINLAFRKQDFQTNRWLFFIPVFSIFWFQFVDAPAADLPLFILTPVVVYLFLNRTEEGDLLAIILSGFLIMIKPSILPLLFLVFLMLDKKNWKVSFIYAGIIGVLFVAKGIWTSGCPLAPYTAWILDLPWAIPHGLQVILPGDSFNFKSIGSNGLVNIFLGLVVFLVYIVYGLSVIRKKDQYPVFIFLTLQVVLVLTTYAQFRFIIPALAYPAAYLLSRVKLPSKFLPVATWCFILLPVIPLFFRLDYRKLTIHENLLRIDIFQAKNIVLPSGITKYPDAVYRQQKCVNFNYYDPDDGTRFIFFTGNGPLPCVKTDYLRYMYKKTGSLPALNTNNLKDGFKNVPVEN